MSQDETTSEDVELTTGSEETLESGKEDNSLGEKKKNPNNMKSVFRERRQLRIENERLKQQLAARSSVETDEGEDDSDPDSEEESFGDYFTDVKSDIFFLKNKDAERYREEMADLIDENPKRKNLPLEDLFDLAKARFPKSTTKKTIDISSTRSQTDVSKLDLSKMTAEEIAELPLDVYKALRKKK